MTPEQAAVSLITAAVHHDDASVHDLAEEVADWDHLNLGRVLGAIAGLAAGIVEYHVARTGADVLPEMGLIAAKWEDE